MPSLCSKFNRPKLIPLFFFLSAFGLTMALGTWQVERLIWKENLIRTMAEANEKNPLTSLPKDDAELAKLQFTKVKLNGTWLGDTEFHLAPRYYNHAIGYHIITPLKLSDGRILLVNRGWVPTEKKLAASRPDSVVHGRGTVTGMVRVGDERNPFTPMNQPARNIWFGRDEAEMANFAHLQNVLPIMVDATGAPQANVLPVPSEGIIHLRNDHLSYVVTWYSIALGILIIFITYHHKKA